MNYNTCRVCKLSSFEHSESLMKYGVRHYAHMSCGLNRWGTKFLAMIPKHQIQNMPYKVVEQYRLKPLFDDKGDLRSEQEWPTALLLTWMGVDGVAV